MADSLVRATLATRVPHEACWVAHDPYSSFEEMRDQAASGSLAIYTGHSGGLLWPAEVNWRMRLAHDSLDHLGERPCDFSLPGEVEAWRNACHRLGEGFAPLLFSEIVLQAAYHSVHGAFLAPQRIVMLNPSQCDRLARTMTRMSYLGAP